MMVTALLVSAQLAHAGDVIDRIVARVNGRIIFLSDWDEELCFEAFVDGRSPAQFTSEQRQGALDRLIDQELLRQQMRITDALPVDPETLVKKLTEIRAAHLEAATEQGWKLVLERYGLTEEEVSRRVSRDLNLMQSIDARLRPSVQIDPSSVEAYYHSKFAGDRAGTQPPPEVAGKIKEVLTEQKLNDLLASWLQTLRTESDIRPKAPSSTSSGEQMK
jgi:hypothetical protein